MRKLTTARFILHVIMGLFLCLWLFGVSQGNLSRLLQGWNLVCSSALLIGFSALCIPRGGFLMLGAAASVLYAVFSIIRFADTLATLPPSATFRSVIGPWKFEGILAHVTLWPPFVIVAIAGIAVIIRQQNEWSAEETKSLG